MVEGFVVVVVLVVVVVVEGRVCGLVINCVVGLAGCCVVDIVVGLVGCVVDTVDDDCSSQEPIGNSNIISLLIGINCCGNEKFLFLY